MNDAPEKIWIYRISEKQSWDVAFGPSGSCFQESEYISIEAHDGEIGKISYDYDVQLADKDAEIQRLRQKHKDEISEIFDRFHKKLME